MSANFHGIYDTLGYHVSFGRHGNDSTHPPSNLPKAPIPSQNAEPSEGGIGG